MMYFIVNPASQSGQGMRIWNELSVYLQNEKVDYKVYFSKYAGHMEGLMRDICESHRNDENPVRVVILGGDGSLDEAIQGIINFDKTYVGYIPTGSSNDFARAMDYNKTPIEQLKAILACDTPLNLDLGKLKYEDLSEERARGFNGHVSDTRYFDDSCGIGFDAEVCEAVEASKTKRILNKIGLGKLVYVTVCFQILSKAKLPTVKLILDNDEEITLKKLRFIVGMNTCYEGGGLMLCPKADPNDGLLDICTVSNIGFLGILTTLPKASSGRHVKNKKLHFYRVKSYEVISETPLWVHTDGEAYAMARHIKVSVKPGLLKFMK